MKKSELLEALHKIGCFNNHNLNTLTGPGGVYIYYRPWESQRCICAGWLVSGAGFVVDPKAHWADYGSYYVRLGEGKTHKEIKENARLTAFAWATEKFGITDWVKGPFGDYISKARLDKVYQMAGIPVKKL